MMFNNLIEFILKLDKSEFKQAAEQLRVFIDEMEIADFKFVVKQIGTIPEIIDHDSTEEKLYSKAYFWLHFWYPVFSRDGELQSDAKSWKHIT